MLIETYGSTYSHGYCRAGDGQRGICRAATGRVPPIGREVRPRAQQFGLETATLRVKHDISTPIKSYVGVPVIGTFVAASKRHDGEGNGALGGG